MSVNGMTAVLNGRPNAQKQTTHGQAWHMRQSLNSALVVNKHNKIKLVHQCVDIMICPQCCPTVSQIEYMPYQHAPYGPLWANMMYPQNWKYTTYCIVVKRTEPHVQKIKFSELQTYGLCYM